ncbi:cation/multidrug efflux pump [Fictibacillus macauensis ZFHKF-1]|uniref:Cation/multidrug efflux pump n=1 Tax=Fictibacillus macauensis ZFHKF-1 TaxID=1196324 RepID=I8UKD6_9BACL|nr:efflux RND transporter permease subunit [Fictibacillus macauensis]EIT87288.1 cation/multidrug efflux pump [Fictibacillus macauensis ZFHKF-1]
MNWLTKFSLKNPVAIFIFSFLLILGGLFSFSSLKVDLLPNVEFPQITVQTVYPGASPQDVNKQVTDPLEEKFKGLDNVKTIKSSSLEGVSIISMEFPFSAKMDDIEKQVNTLASDADLPDSAKPDVKRFSFGTIPIYNISLFPKKGDSIQGFVEKELVPELKKIQGVNNISVGGVQENYVSITVDEKKAQKLGLSLSAIKDTIKSRYISFPAGNVNTKEVAVPVRVNEKVKTIAALKELKLTPASQGPKESAQSAGPPAAPKPGGPPQASAPASATPPSVKLKDVATVKQAKDVKELTRYNQKASLSMAVTKKQDANTVDVADQVTDVLQKKKFKDKLDYTIGFDQAASIKDSVNSLVKEGLFGALFASIAVLLFLRNVRATIIAIISIPLSLLISAIFLNQLDITLNIMTLGGMAVAVGRVVDDSIVVIENIFRRIRKSDGTASKNELVIQSTKEILRAIVSSTITTVVVFLPLGFVGGITGEFFLPFALTVVFSLLASLLVAITIVPVLAKFSFKKVKPENNNEGPLVRLYERVIRSSLNHKVIVLVTSVLLLAGSLFLSTKLGMVFLPNEEQKTITANIELPVSTTVKKTNDISLKIEQLLADRKDTVKDVTAGVGSRDFQTGLKRENVANYFINLKKSTDVSKEIKVLEKEMKEIVNNKKAVITLQEAQSGGPPSNNEVKIDLYSNNLNDLQKAAASVEDYMKSRNDLKYVSNNFKDTQRQFDVEINTKKASEQGVSGFALLGAVTDATKPLSVGKLELNDKESDVRLVYNKKPSSIDDLKKLKVFGAKGPVSLDSVATVKDINAATAIQKLDGKVYAQVSAQVTNTNIQGVTKEVTDHVNGMKLPDSISTNSGGGNEETVKTFKELGLAILVAIGLVYLTMLITFGRARIPFIILSSLLFVPVGAIGGLYLTNEPLSVSVMIGILMLIGIVTTNAIVLVDRIGQNRELKEMSIRESLLEAGKTRLRPILMTAFATIAALIPLALTSSSGTLISKGLAVVVIGGLVTSTLLTLIIVPVLYELFFRKQAKKEQKQQN